MMAIAIALLGETVAVAIVWIGAIIINKRGDKNDKD